jgi:hypothetical protein
MFNWLTYFDAVEITTMGFGILLVTCLAFMF